MEDVVGRCAADEALPLPRWRVAQIKTALCTQSYPHLHLKSNFYINSRAATTSISIILPLFFYNNSSTNNTVIHKDRYEIGTLLRSRCREPELSGRAPNGQRSEGEHRAKHDVGHPHHGYQRTRGSEDTQEGVEGVRGRGYFCYSRLTLLAPFFFNPNHQYNNILVVVLIRVVVSIQYNNSTSSINCIHRKILQ